MRPPTRRYGAVAAFAAAVLALGLVVAAALRGTDGLAAAPSASAHVAAAPQHLTGPPPAGPGAAFASCEQQLDRTHPPGAPRLAVVGASFTAGVGSSPGLSWAAQLARHLHLDAVIYGVPGAGYVRPGARHGGPVANELAHAGLGPLKPSLIIVQAGHDDIGVPAALERQRVTQAIRLLHTQAPQARLVLLTVFPGHAPQAAALRTDQTIVTAARAADPAVLIIDPLTGRWIFPHIRDGLHPTAAGSAWIASHVATALATHGLHPAPVPSTHLVICHQP